MIQPGYWKQYYCGIEKADQHEGYQGMPPVSLAYFSYMPHQCYAMNPITVCIVEDQPEVLEGLTGLVSHAPDMACTGSFSNGQLAVAGIPRLQPDIVLMDLVMPVMGGIEAIRRLKMICPGMLFMVVTMHDEDEIVFDALRAGATGYLLKSNSYPTLTTAIRELYNGGSPMSSTVARKVVCAFHRQATEDKDTTSITKRERQVLQAMTRGLNYKEVATELFISSKTVRKHMFNIYEKLHVHSKTAAINKFLGRK